MAPPSVDPDGVGPGSGDATSFLARRAQDGDAASFGALYQRIGPALFVWARVRIRPPLVGRLDPEDVAQEVWLRASARFATFDPAVHSFRAWIFAIAKLVLLEACRAARRPAGGGARLEGSRAGLEGLADEATSISRLAARDERIRAFVARVLALSEDDRRILVHCGLEGMTAVEAAARLDATPDAVKKRWQRLRRRLEEEGLPEALVA